MPTRTNDFEKNYVVQPSWPSLPSLVDSLEHIEEMVASVPRFGETQLLCLEKAIFDERNQAVDHIQEHNHLNESKQKMAEVVADFADKFDVAELIKDGILVLIDCFLRKFAPIDSDSHFVVVGHPRFLIPRLGVSLADCSIIDQINAAVAGNEPLELSTLDRHWMGKNRWLVGTTLWKFSDRELNYSQDERKYLLLEAADKERRKFERLRSKFESVPKGERKRISIPESVRIFVWRRDQGQCTNCASQERLEYDHIIPVSKGGSSTERNIQLLCETCNRRKSDRI